MENNQNARVKGPDEKYCSECGEIINIKAEICPKCGVRQLNISNNTENSGSSDKKLGVKFLYSGAVSLAAFVVLILVASPQSEWINGIIGAFMFALVAALIGMAMPTSKKIIYIPSSLAIMFAMAMIVGLAVQ